MLKKYRMVIVIALIVATIFFLTMLILHYKLNKEYEKTARRHQDGNGGNDQKGTQLW